jgi:hypothetical protein
MGPHEGVVPDAGILGMLRTSARLVQIVSFVLEADVEAHPRVGGLKGALDKERAAKEHSDKAFRTLREWDLHAPQDQPTAPTSR